MLIKLGSWQSLAAIVKPVRHQVFVLEQNVPPHEEWDEFDEVSMHFAFLKNHHVIACARLLPSVERQSYLGRVAVLAQYRRQGVASRLIDKAIEVARERGDLSLLLHAQVDALVLYQKHGFLSIGDVFFEVNIAHQKMQLLL